MFIFYPGESLNIACCQPKYILNGWICVMMPKVPEKGHLPTKQ